MKKTNLIVVSCVFAMILIAGELVTRYALGLANPPLSVPHPTIEYMFKPSSEYYPLGNYFKTNQYGMRSEEFPLKRRNNEVRILILGDSVPNGGKLTDQSELATELLREKIRELVSVPVFAGNISAGSWSPPNLLAYVREFGTFDADAAFVILNRADMFDFPTFSSLSPNTHPTRKPASALLELLTRYVAPRVRGLLTPEPEKGPAIESNRKNCSSDLLQLIRQFSEQEIPVFIIYHPSEDEITQEGGFEPKGDGYREIKRFAEDHSITLFSFAQRYGESIAQGQNPFRDLYHPNALGQQLMSDHILSLLNDDGLTQQWSQRR